MAGTAPALTPGAARGAHRRPRDRDRVRVLADGRTLRHRIRRRARKRVFCERPVGFDLDRIGRMIDAADEAGVTREKPLHFFFERCNDAFIGEACAFAEARYRGGRAQARAALARRHFHIGQVKTIGRTRALSRAAV